ncbi:hypothetical protein H0H81_012595 [Sphagnurus paluster]|uniref:CoA-binding domain-containing protein n=1 Tax=Sphagnurus paluster TaxID=117069 RepID=A0A9P7KNG3_9AGAR|nr:hypothetical protein H0H81_012595 [Sphagnurus paluster]
MSYDFGTFKPGHESVAQKFLATPSFAVVGASKDQTKVGNRILRWYQTREFNVTPVHPKEPELEGIKTITDISELPSPNATALSIITPPKVSAPHCPPPTRAPQKFPTQVTLAVVEKAKELDVPFLWIQPGAEDEAVLDYIKTHNLTDRVIYGGACLLVLGDGVRSNL